MKNALGMQLLLSFLVLGVSGGGAAQEAADQALLEALEWRELGPWRGGRVTTVTGVRGRPGLYYMGATGGGVWRTVNGGATWENLSDDQFKVGTIGAVAVAPSDPNVLYVGTGESPIRGVTTSHGDGVWKSTDAGQTWRHVGLPEAGQISRIKVHPRDADTAWVAVQGQIWGPSKQRGVFKTTDGGASWRHVLDVNPRTGAADLAMDPGNPRVLYAAMWHHGRTPWFINSGGPGGGIYKSVDGGETWDRLGGGLPELVGKIGIDVAASRPSRVYAIVEAEGAAGGLYRSDDAGASWTLVNGRRVLHTRPWYYNHVTADPTDENTVWVLNVPLMKSVDGGRTFERVYTPHGDHHDHWINPDDPLNMINGNDGGATVTYDGGATWSSLLNQPTAQFYRVVTDKLDPFRVYGGQQDNTTLAIASASRDGGIGLDDQFDVGGGESAHIAFDPDDPTWIYATTINNALTVFNVDTGYYRSIRPYPERVFGMDARDLRYRANWNAPVIVSPHDPEVVYYGTHVLLRSTDRGLNWTEISPDLTRDDPERQGRNGGPITPENVGAEYYNTIFAIAESPHERGVLWVGADDGLVHLSRDGGESWQDVTPDGAPEGMVNSLEPSPHEPGTAYFPLARYKLNDFRPYIYRTTDYGRRWRRIDEGLPQDTFVRVVREDPGRAGLLFAGTEAGLFVTWDGGRHWQSMQATLPPVPITDLAIRRDSLIAATQGRGFWVLDDLGPLRELDGVAPDAPLHVFTPSDQRLGRNGSSGGEFEAANPPAGVVLRYALAHAAEGPLEIDITDADGNLVRRYSSTEGAHDRCVLGNMDLRSPFELAYPGTAEGLNAWEWDLARQPLDCIDEARNFAGFDGASVRPGEYRATVRVDGHEQSASFRVLPDPTFTATEAEWQAWEVQVSDLTGLYNRITAAIDGARRARREIAALLDDHPQATELQQAGAAANRAIDDWEARVHQVQFDTFEDEDSWPVLIDGQVRYLLLDIDSAGPPVAAGALQRKADLEAQWREFRAELETLRSGPLHRINAWARAAGLEHVPDPVPGGSPPAADDGEPVPR